jgi:Fe/S biogenesis protein NfuA
MSFMLTITEAAKKQIQSIMEAQGRQGDNLRVGIIGRSSTGFRYTMNLLEAGQENTDDIEAYGEDFKVFVDPQSAENLTGATIDFIDQGMQGSGFKIDNPNPVWTDSIAIQIQEIIDNQINPGIASHGGHVEMLDFQEGTVYVRLGGGCQGCGMVDVTLRQGIEALLKESVTEVEQVVDTTDHASGTNPYYQPAKG